MSRERRNGEGEDVGGTIDICKVVKGCKYPALMLPVLMLPFVFCLLSGV